MLNKRITTLSFNSETNTLIIGDADGTLSSYNVINWKHKWHKKLNQNEQYRVISLLLILTLFHCLCKIENNSFIILN